MFVLKKHLQQFIGKEVKVLGTPGKIASPQLVISTPGGDILVTYTELYKYSDNMVIVTGTVQGNLSINESCVDVIPNDFCINTYERMVELSMRTSEIFVE